MSVVDNNDFDGKLSIRSLTNTMGGAFVLYQTDIQYLESKLTVAIKSENTLAASLSVRVPSEKDFNSTIKVVYRDYEHMEATLDVVASTYIESFIEVRPNNRMFGVFELLPAPRTEKSISVTEDSTTRSRPDLMTINYGDSQRMMVGTGLTDDGTETLESFIRFGDIVTQLADMSMLETAKLRLYYTGTIPNGTNIELHYPSSKWSEYGVTHANRPVSTGMLTSAYTINDVQKYIEFDVIDVVNEWFIGSIYNYGLIIKSSGDDAVTFYTREGRYKPVINVKYIDSKIMSLGRADLNSTMFVWANGLADPRAHLNSHFLVQSDRGWEYFDSTLHVHTPDEVLLEEFNSIMAVSMRDLASTTRIARREYDDQLRVGLTVQVKSETKMDIEMAISKPDQVACLTIDPNISLKSTFKVMRSEMDDKESILYVSRREINATMITKKSETIDATLVVQANQEDSQESVLYVSRREIDSFAIFRAYGESDFVATMGIWGFFHEPLDSLLYISRREISGRFAVRVSDASSLNSTLVIKRNEDDDRESLIYVSRREIDGFAIFRAYAEDNMDSHLYIRAYDERNIESFIHVSRREIIGSLTPRVIDESNLTSNLWVPYYENFESTMMIHQKSEIVGTMMIYSTTENLGHITITTPNLLGYLYPRVIGETDLNSFSHIRQRDASDLDGRLVIGGMIGAYYFII